MRTPTDQENWSKTDKFSKMTSICNIVLLLSFHGNKLALKFFESFAKL